jgi:TetR/AcrR family transcriptional regulator
MPATKKTNRKAQILQALASMLESHHGQRITTAKLAENVGVSDFIEETLFSRINKITEDEKDAANRCQLILHLILGFAEKNPGITRILNGDALMGEQERLRERIAQLFDRLEVQIKQILRERKLREGKDAIVDEALLANMLICFVDGKINQYVRSQFTRRPTQQFNEHWAHIRANYLS